MRICSGPETSPPLVSREGLASTKRTPNKKREVLASQEPPVSSLLWTLALVPAPQISLLTFLFVFIVVKNT